MAGVFIFCLYLLFIPILQNEYIDTANTVVDAFLKGIIEQIHGYDAVYKGGPGIRRNGVTVDELIVNTFYKKLGAVWDHIWIHSHMSNYRVTAAGCSGSGARAVGGGSLTAQDSLIHKGSQFSSNSDSKSKGDVGFEGKPVRISAFTGSF